MPDKSWHLAKNAHNLKARAQLQSANAFLDWEVTTIFYSALHYVDAFFTTITPPIHPRAHRVRRKLVSRYLHSIANDYRKLNTLSEKARYKAYVVQPSDIVYADRCYSNVKAFLETVVR